MDISGKIEKFNTPDFTPLKLKLEKTFEVTVISTIFLFSFFMMKKENLLKTH